MDEVNQQPAPPAVTQNQQQNVTSETSIDQPPKKSRKMVWMLLGVILILILGGGGYFVLGNSSQKQAPVTKVATAKPTAISQPLPIMDPTANWKTYTDNELGISFKYPPEWDYRADSPPAGYSEFVGFKLKNNGVGGLSFSFSLTNSIPFKDILAQEREAPVVVESKTSVDNLPAYKFVHGSMTDVVVQRNNIVSYVFYQNYNADNFDKLLSTIKFIQSTP